MLYAPIFILGLFFGSFAGVVVHRLHSGEKGIFAGRSHCPKCKHQLGFFDLFPLFSYIFSGGKCRYCKKKISVFYPCMELFTGGLFLLTATMVGTSDTLNLAFYLLMSFIFVLLTVYDLLFQEVPDEISLPAIVLSATFIIWAGILPWKSVLIGMAIPVLFFLALFLFSKGQWLGGGDVRVGGIMGALLGYPMVLVALFLAYLVGSVFSVGGMATKKITRKSHIPFVPFLLLGTYIAMFWGDGILDWYMGLLVI